MRTSLMSEIFLAGAVLAAMLCATPASAQGQPGMVPGVPGIEPPRIEPAPPKIPPDFQEPAGEKKQQPRRVFDSAKAHQEAFELAFLANQIPDEVQKLDKHVLPKDLIQKLKRIEKLSKHLRAQVTQ